MKILRHLPTALAAVAALAVLVFAAVMSPPVQTWYLRRVLAWQTEWHVEVEQVFAGFSHVEVSGVKVERGGVIWRAPKVDLDMSVWRAWRDHRLTIQRLQAKDWTVKFANASADAAGTDSVKAIPALANGVANWSLPWAVSLEEAVIEGDVLSPHDDTTSSLHLTANGGGFGAGRSGKFAVVAKAYDARLPENALAVQADLSVSSDDGRSLRRVALKGALASGAGNRVVTAGGPGWNFLIEAERAAEGLKYQAAIERENRALATLHATWDAAAARFTGDWQAALHEGDAAVLGLGTLLPSLLEGEGRFSATADAATVALTGRLRTAGRSWPALQTWLAPLGATTVAAEFDLEKQPTLVHVNALTVALDGARPIAELKTSQPFEYRWETHEIRATDPAHDWGEVDVKGWPLSWWGGRTGSLAIAGGDLTGRLAVTVGDGTWDFRTLAPVVAKDVSLRRGGRTLAQELAVQVKGKAQLNQTSGAWLIELAPLGVAKGGGELGRFDLKFVQTAKRGEPVAVNGKWTLDLAALRHREAVPGLDWLTASYAAGEVQGTLGSGYADLLLQTTIAGTDDTHAASGAIRVDLYGDGSYAIAAPLTLTFGRSVSELRIDWEWRADQPKTGIDLKIEGQRVVLDHLRRFAAPLAALGNGAASGGVAPGARPFWGDWFGRARIDIARLQLADRELIDLGGYLKIAPDHIELLGGHGGLPEHSRTQIEGALTFEASSSQPYALKLSMAPYRGDAEDFFGTPPKGKDPLFTGRFEITRTVSAQGATLAELLTQREDVFKLSGTNGIIRLLKAGVTQALPPPPDASGVVNTLDSVGTGFLRVLGANTKSLTSGQIKVSDEKEAVLDFDNSMAEIGYDTITLTAACRLDGSVNVSQFEMTGSDVHLTGTGALGFGEEGKWLTRSLSADLQLAVRGRLADLLKKAGLLGDQKDAAGYEIVAPTIKFGGTLARPTQDEWRARLAAAASAPAKKAAK